jgi:hypothetical protein
MCAVLLLSAPGAWAGTSVSVAPSIPTNVTVGQTNVPATLLIRNISFNGVGQTNYDTDSFQLTDITLVASCGSQVFSADCPAGSRDPGVIVPSPLTGSGQAGTACAGRTFTISLIDAAQGKYRFTPDATVIVGPSGGPAAAASCTILFTSTISKMATIDSAPGAAVQTDQKGFAAVEDITVGSPNFGITAAGIGTAQTTVSRATPSLSTQASGPLALGGGPLTDAASITQLVNPTTTGAGVGSVEFRLYGPDDAACATAATFTSSSRPLTFSSATAASATSGAFTATLAGVYRWRAFFSGDANNNPVAGQCNAVNESVVVSSVPAPPAPPPPPPPPPPPALRLPAKLEVTRSRVVVSTRHLDVLAPISALASGTVKVAFRAAGRTTSFTTPVDSATRRVRINRVIPATQARVGTGILTLTYPGDADTQPQTVRLRAAAVHADLQAGGPTIAAGRLKATGRISPRARGNVRVQLLFEPPGQNTRTLEFSAKISGGRYSLNQKLSADVLAQIAQRRGVVHSYTLFTGYLPARMRGEMASLQVLPAR